MQLFVSSSCSSWEFQWNFAERKERKKNAHASWFDRKYLWHMISIIKEEKSFEFTRLDTLKSGNVNSVSHPHLLCQLAQSSPDEWERQKRGNIGAVISSPYFLSSVLLRSQEIKTLMPLLHILAAFFQSLAVLMTNVTSTIVNEEGSSNWNPTISSVTFIRRGTTGKHFKSAGGAMYSIYMCGGSRRLPV